MIMLYTTGYQGESANSFLDKLTKENIDVVVDVRQNPFSFKPGFSRKPLVEKLKAQGIKYLHFQELGTPLPLRKLLADKKDYKTFFEMYENFLPEFKDALIDLIDLGSDKKVCIMCFEKDFHFCHRKVVVDYLNNYCGKNIKITHL